MTRVMFFLTFFLNRSKYCIHIAPKGNNYTLQPIYNMGHYNTVLDIIRYEDGSQKYIDYT